MTSGRVGRPDITGSGANDAVSSRASVMSFVTVCPFSQVPEVGVSRTGRVNVAPHSGHMTLTLEISSLAGNAALTSTGKRSESYKSIRSFAAYSIAVFVNRPVLM